MQVFDGALTLREQLMPEVTVRVEAEVKDLARYWGDLHFDDHWFIERCLKLKPHFEHASWVLTKKKGLVPTGVHLLQVLLTADSHWKNIRQKAEAIQGELKSMECPADANLSLV